MLNEAALFEPAQMRQEQEIFDELAQLCVSPGYIHAIAHLCFRDNMVGFADELTAKALLKTYSLERLIRTEITTLIGLLIKQDIDFGLPRPEIVARYLERTDALLKEMHDCMTAAMTAEFKPEKLATVGFNPTTTGVALREAIFYGGESAYGFQYRDFAPQKYADDDDWLVKNKRFSIHAARDIVHAVGLLQNEKVLTALTSLRTRPVDEWTLLPGYIVTVNEISERSGIDKSIVTTVLDAFTVPYGEKNRSFGTLSDFNAANAYPLIPAENGEYILLQSYGLVEALYDAPFYWMGADKSYEPTAMKNRGRFAERFAAERLEHVFGNTYVHPNVYILNGGGNRAGEIDVLVIFGDRAIVLQAKSKRLTLEARRGNDQRIRDDFKKSIEDSYEQGFRCASLLNDPEYKLVDSAGNDINRPRLKDIYVICLVSDHYPALSFQAHEFLKSKTTDAIHPPFVMDVFALDAMTEMLGSPLHLLSYIDRRVGYTDKLSAAHELTILSYHLKRNLWLSGEHDFVMLMDDISADLDVAMAVRREGVPGKATPDGILTRLDATEVGRIIREIEARPEGATLDLGFMLLTLRESTVLDASRGIRRIAALSQRDGKNHDFTVAVGDGRTGLTVHCNHDPPFIAGPLLRRHCELRKYSQRANSWFGLCIGPADARVRFGVTLGKKWQRDSDFDALTAAMPPPGKLSDLHARRKSKPGRNSPCPCGSGKKYKRCCGA